jgi:enoyl-CoA hydratase/carnithine racemase
VILDRPQTRNAVTAGMLEELASALGRAAADPRARVVVLSGEGPDFCAGADLGELEAAAGGAQSLGYGRPLEEALDAVTHHPLPVVAVIQGAALGAGCQLAVAADLAVAAEDARLGIPSARLGVVTGFDILRRLVGAVGAKRAGELLLAGRTVTGEEAARWGLVNEAVPAERLPARGEELAGQVAAGAPLSVRTSKRGIGLAVDGPDPAEFEMMAAQVMGSADLKEGLRAFRERRAPRFEGS